MANGQYDDCPSCGNVREDTAVHRCNKCRAVFCENCATPALLGKRCPGCGHGKGAGFGKGWQTLGRIVHRRTGMLRNYR